MQSTSGQLLVLVLELFQILAAKVEHIIFSLAKKITILS